MRCWCVYLSGARCRLFAYGPADATAIPKPHHLLPHYLNRDWFLPFRSGLTQVVLEKRLLHRCSSSNSSSGRARRTCQSLTFPYTGNTALLATFTTVYSCKESQCDHKTTLHKILKKASNETSFKLPV